MITQESHADNTGGSLGRVWKLWNKCRNTPKNHSIESALAESMWNIEVQAEVKHPSYNLLSPPFKMRKVFLPEILNIVKTHKAKSLLILWLMVAKMSEAWLFQKKVDPFIMWSQWNQNRSAVSQSAYQLLSGSRWWRLAVKQKVEWRKTKDNKSKTDDYRRIEKHKAKQPLPQPLKPVRGRDITHLLLLSFTL